MSNQLIDPARFGMPEDGYDPSGNGYYCRLCNSRLAGRNWSQLHRHITTHKHMSKLDPQLREELEYLSHQWQHCPYCGERLPRDITRRQHILAVHPGCEVAPEQVSNVRPAASTLAPTPVPALASPMSIATLEGHEIFVGLLQRLAESCVATNAQHLPAPDTSLSEFQGLEGEKLIEAVLKHFIKTGDVQGMSEAT
ncbi:hypothetical protein CERSUDRAFT_82443 [Gelatoporia subvermispora B]|uniref:C2H2-type domain-containing protein n=1 Tax=Ceriporiopsis subvermispora (strain B) TaxID=914234 RepID=M2RH95_CERS8|nr:hypothetical protein CERSUDRAFT_82443 [Gelatoporia subvermispora B]